MTKFDLSEIDLKKAFKCEMEEKHARGEQWWQPKEWPDIYLRNNFIGGALRTKGNGEGQYPDPYLDWIESCFGREPDTMELCSRYVQADGIHTKYTVDINKKFNPTFCCDAQTLSILPPSLRVKRIRADPPYNEKTAREMYGTSLPDFYKLLEAGSRHLELGGLFFLLLGPYNYQNNVDALGLRRVGLVAIFVVPNKEIRACNIFQKMEDKKVIYDDGQRQSQLLMIDGDGDGWG